MGITKQKNILVVILFLAILLLTATKYLSPEVYANTPKGQMLIINQVRGNECCDKGSFENLKIQVEASISNRVPATFVLRYDALNNSQYVNYLREKSIEHPEIIKLGLFLEITPQLAKDSGVEYEGNSTNWFSAKNLYSIGYSDTDNSLIGDLLFDLFYKKFGYYPDTVSSWILKTDFLNFLKDKYDIKIAEITREQWDVDSYTLYGGPPHYPYPASKNWIFNPDYKSYNSVLIVRQALTDPLYNYGDKTSSFTSQPNDYLRNKDFGYFQKLLDQAMNQPSGEGFALLGLENSMELRYQREFIKQIEYIKKFKNSGSVSFPNAEEMSSFWAKQKINFYTGSDLIKNSINQAIWITTPEYRLRIRRQAGKVYIDDIRVFNSNFKDPYSYSVSKRGGFWITPFLMDGSLNNIEKNISLFSAPKTDNKFTHVLNDYKKSSAKIDLPNIASGTKLEFSEGEISYADKNNRRVKFLFSDNGLILNNVDFRYLKYSPNKVTNYPIKHSSNKNGFELIWRVGSKNWISSIMKCQKNQCLLNFFIDYPLSKKALSKYYEFLLPEQYGHILDNSQTVLYANNQYAIAGRNPVRLVLIPYDRYGIITNIKNGCVDILVSYPESKCTQDDKRYFLDINSNTYLVKQVDVRSKDGAVNKSQKIYFAPNCKQKLRDCILNPHGAWLYLNAIIGDKVRLILHNEKQ